MKSIKGILGTGLIALTMATGAFARPMDHGRDFHGDRDDRYQYQYRVQPYRDDYRYDNHYRGYDEHPAQRAAAIIGGTAAAGAVIGALAGHGTGAAIGAVTGGIAGLAIDQATQHHHH